MNEDDDDDDDDDDADDGWDGLAGPAWETRCSSDDAHATDKDGRCKTGISHAAPLQYRFERAGTVLASCEIPVLQAKYFRVRVLTGKIQ